MTSSATLDASSNPDGGASDSQPGPARESTRNRVIRLGGYTAWTVAALALPLALDRLVVCPILRERFGKEAFGGLMWVRALAYMFGNNLANGFSIPFLRDMIRRTDDEVRIQMRCALALTAAMTSLTMVVVNLVAYFFAGPFVQNQAWAYFVPFTGLAIARSLELVITVRLRVLRRVKQIFLLRAVEGVTLGISAFLLETNVIVVIAGIYFLSAFIPMVLSGYFNRNVLGRGRWWDRNEAIGLLNAAPAGVLMVAIDNAQVYLPIILLGAIAGQNFVSPFYAAGVAYAFLMPVTYLGVAVLNLIAGKKSFDLHGQRGRLYLSATLGLALIVGVLSYVVGWPLVKYFYPADAPVTFTYFHWFAVANGCASVRSMMRPIGLKFARLWTVVMLSGITLAVQVVALVALIPNWEDWGAAVALAISSAVGMVIWLIIFEQFRRTPHSIAEAAASLDSGAES